MRNASISLMALLAGLSPAAAQVAAVQAVEVEKVVKKADGSVSLNREPAEIVAPGEEVIYSIRFKNEGADAASDIVLVMPVPEEVSYMEGSADGRPSTITFSADGGKTYLTRGRLTVRENGRERPATGAEITNIKWVLTEPVAPQTSGEVYYRGVVK